MSFLRSSIIHVHPFFPVLFLLACFYLFSKSVSYSTFSAASILSFPASSAHFILLWIFYFLWFSPTPSSSSTRHLSLRFLFGFFNLITCHRIHVVVLNRHTIPHVCTWVFYFIYLWFIVVDIFRVLHFPLDFQNKAPLFCSAGLFP